MGRLHDNGNGHLLTIDSALTDSGGIEIHHAVVVLRCCRYRYVGQVYGNYEVLRISFHNGLLAHDRVPAETSAVRIRADLTVDEKKGQECRKKILGDFIAAGRE